MDIKKGDFITIARWIGSNDRSWTRDCMEVKAVDYPLIRVNNHGQYGFSGKNMLTLNLKEIEVKKLSKEFILSVIPDYKGRLPSDARANDFDDKLLITWVAVCVCAIFYLL